MSKALTIACLGLFASAAPAMAEPTEVMVRVLAADAKFIGSSMGGMNVTLEDARTGAILASGKTEGGTGDTGAIMSAAGRSSLRAQGDAAGYLAVVDIDRPTLVELSVEGPIGHPASSVRASVQRWIMPGQDVTRGDGWVVEAPGIVISNSVTQSGLTMTLAPKIELLCGCPITPGGPWKAADYVVVASLWREDERFGEANLAFTESPGRYSGALTAPGPGRYTLFVHAQNRVTGNSGMVSQSITIKD